MELRPGVEVRLQEAPYEDELLAMVERGSLDFTFALVPPEGPFEHIEILRDPYVLLTQAGSALAQRERAPTIAEIGRLPLIAYSRSTYGIEALLRSRGIEPHVVFRSDESGAVQRMVAAGIGSALVPRLAVDRVDPRPRRARRLAPRARAAVGLAWHRDATLPEAAQDFVDAVLARCAELTQILSCHPVAPGNGNGRNGMRVGMLTGGGDCPGLNAVIRAATRRLVDGGAEPVGVLRGWRGMIDGLFRPLDLEAVSGILPRGGTILRTSRTNPFNEEGGIEAVKRSFEQLDGLIAIGGEDSLGVAARLHAEFGLPVVGVPKTIDNDLAATDHTFGFDTAVSIATEAIDRLHTTAESHDRVIVVEVMGRNAGWLAVRAASPAAPTSSSSPSSRSRSSAAPS